jgi:hypothetical protein
MVLDPKRIEVIDDRVAAILRAMAPSDRVRRGLQMHATARQIRAARIRTLRPDVSWEEAMILATKPDAGNAQGPIDHA